MTDKIEHQKLPFRYFQSKDNCLAVNGRSATDLVKQVGQTPFFVYARDVIERRIAELRCVLPKEVALHYAVKANPMPAVVQTVVPLVDGLDVASAGEMQVALNAGMPAEFVSFAGPGKSVPELRRAIAAGICLNVESEKELERINELASPGHRARVAIRVNPDFELKISGMKMGGGPKPFGIDAEQVPETLTQIGKHTDFIGFHIFGGSQSLKPEAIVDAQTKAVDLAIRLANHAPSPVRKLNIGGGFGIPYFPGDQPLDLRTIKTNLERLVVHVADKLPDAKLILELGRYLVGEAGVYICRILDRKISRGHVFLITDGGLHHHLAASGNFGQVIRKNYPVLIANRLASDIEENVSIVGPLCTPLDILGDKVNLPPADTNDLVAVFQSGAYGLTASPAKFLSHPEASEILV